MLRRILIITAVLTCSAAYSQTWLPAFFSDHMVLQQNEPVAVWGKDDPRTNITVTGSWGADAVVKTDKNGKWQVSLQPTAAGGPYTLTVKGTREIIVSDILFGEVWFCSGQSNMEMSLDGYNNQPVNGSNEEILHSENDQIRMFTVTREASLEPLDDVTGEWEKAAPGTTGHFSATAYFFGKKLQSVLHVPVGLIHSSWGGSKAEAWMDEEALAAFPSLPIPEQMPETRPNHTPTLLYNAMVHPFIGYAMKGAIWYQGESNREQPAQYQSLFPAMIRSWRGLWQQGDFPFYFVQIAPYKYDGNDAVSSALLREAQLNAMLHTEHTGMAVTMDIGDCDCIHPAEKNLVGKRLAYWALARDYGIEGVAFAGPVYREMEITEDGRIRLSFDHVGTGLSFYGKDPAGFEIAGSDRVFHPAMTKINNDRTLTVWSDDVSDPVAVRYAFRNCVEGTLYNTRGLPASSFRTDDWEE